MNHTNELGELGAALAEFQRTINNPAFSRTVQVKSSGGSYSFSYAELPSILDLVRPKLAAQGLSFVQTVGTADGAMAVTTMLLHKSGQWISDTMPIPTSPQAKLQEIGSAVSYAKRYGLVAILGIAAEEDDDANSADGNTITGSAGAKRDPLAKPRWGSGPPPHTTPKAKAEVAFVPAETYEEFHTRAVAAGKRIAQAPDGPAYLDGIGKNYGFSMKPDAPNRYDSFELKILNQALCDMEAY